MLLLAGIAALWFAGPRLSVGVLDMIQDSMRSIRHTDFSMQQAQVTVTELLGRTAGLLALFFGLLVATALFVGSLQVGVHFVPALLAPKWEKLSFTAGWRRMFSLSATVRGLFAIFKVCLVAALAYWVLKGRSTQIMNMGAGNLATASTQAWGLAIRLALAIAASLALLGVVDYAYQRFRFERSLRMSRQELKDELKREEGDPQIRARIRKMQREMAKKRMLQDVPRATVVITNPTHLAVALRYERGKAGAPLVVAKGAGFVALRIMAIARRHAVPVVERKPVAQALYKAVKVGQEIPGALYVAVAEVLAYIYRLRGAV
jgi:flagellar biosynthetic protein FlhB